MAINTFSGGNFINSLQAAGKNTIINGGFDIWQRGTSIAGNNVGGASYWADRWNMYRSANPTAYTLSQQTSGATAGITNFARVQRTASNTTTQTITIGQTPEISNIIGLAGQTITLSFYARAGANYSPTSGALAYVLNTGTGTSSVDGIYNALTSQATVINTSATLTTSWQRFTSTVTLASTVTQLSLQFNCTPTGTAGAADYYDITGVQLELGSTATTFSRAGGTIQGELAACQRYYYRSTGVADQNRIATLGGNPTTSIFDCNVAVPSTFRGTVSAIDVANIGVYINNNNTVYSGGTWTVLTGIATAPTVRYTHTSGAMTQGHNGFIVQNGATAGYFGLSAEL
jgi:hypothetical protein